MPDGNAVLTILFSQSRPAANEHPAAPPSPSPEESAQQAAIIKQMFKGFRMGLAIDVEGKIVKTNSPYVDGSKVTLIDIDFDPLLSDEKVFKTVSAKLEKTMGDDRKTMEVLKGVKGFKIVTDPEVSIEFTPK
jgi:hypothetical protein